jgi:hypothetical protein
LVCPDDPSEMEKVLLQPQYVLRIQPEPEERTGTVCGVPART